ncbi:hypothetical protein NPIL_704731 [Nephila pilipes]|uniref:Uncharacterized protein n=1 Tax=Nephila pilipes TaxID=299642 RepID=A0A8X6NHZ9_NEPPI|nr:hypothetical protein NPIL_704731 [Nephila pilipes]
MSNHFLGENFWGRHEDIWDLLKNEENYVSEDESENEVCVEIQNHEFSDRDKDKNDELSFEGTDEVKTRLEKQIQENENKNLKSETNAEVSTKTDWF